MADVAAQYLQGLIHPGKKNMERMAEKVANSDHQSLHHFLSESPWDERALIKKIGQEADQLLGGTPDSALLFDETGVAKKGTKSVGVQRQWLGRHGKVDNGQVAVFGSLCCREQVQPIDVRLFLTESWTSDKARCLAAGVPGDRIVAKTKQALALEIVREARANGLRFNWVGGDAFYGIDPSFLRELDSLGECFVIDVHRDQRIYLQDPKPYIPSATAARGRKPSCLKTDEPPIRVDAWAKQQPGESWQTVHLRRSTQGELFVQVLHRQVWLWDGKEPHARAWRLIVRREVNSPDEIKYSLSNANASVSVERLAYMQGQRYWIERAFQDAKTHCGMADYQVRGWRGWHHHMVLVMLAMLFHLEERLHQKENVPLLTLTDIIAMLSHFLPRRAINEEEVLRQMEERHRKRLAGMKSAAKKQRVKYPELIARLT